MPKIVKIVDIFLKIIKNKNGQKIINIIENVVQSVEIFIKIHSNCVKTVKKNHENLQKLR